MAKKKNASKALFAEPPITSYKYVSNRLMVVDWASLAYHMFHSLNSAKNKERYGLLDAEGEISLWRTFMIGRIMDLIVLFNPKHIIFALEGKQAWRRNFVKEYYEEHTEVYWDKQSYYVLSDNTLYKVSKASDDSYVVGKMNLADLKALEEAKLKHKKLKEFKEPTRKMLWGIYDKAGDPIVPSYKGQRKSKEWLFAVDKKVWAEYREAFAKELAPLFRARAVQCHTAEGDDVIYASVKKFAGDSDDVIVVTRDSDMTQINLPNVKIYDHLSGNFINEADPVKYLDAKVLSGDESDNIHGMAFVDTRKGLMGKYRGDKDKRLGNPGARTLLEACPNIYETAKENGWVDQYMRNRTLIDLSRIPSTVAGEIDLALSAPEPEQVVGAERLEFWGVTGKYIRMYRNLQSTGFFAVNPLNGGIPFNRGLFVQKEAEDARHVDEDFLNSVPTFKNLGDLGGVDDIDVIF